MRNLINRAQQPGHLYPMAMFSYPVMPPPKTVDKALGERRLTAWSGVGISVCEELDWQAVVQGERGGGLGRGQARLQRRGNDLRARSDGLQACTAWQEVALWPVVLCIVLLSAASGMTLTSLLMLR
jgi:hypothetical protein